MEEFIMAIDFSEVIELKGNVIKEIKSMEWKVKAFDPENKYNEDKESVVGILPEFERVNGKQKPIADSVQYYQIKVTAMFDSENILEDDELVFSSKELSVFEDLERKDKIKVKIDKDLVELRLGLYKVTPTLVVADVKDAKANVSPN